MRLMRTGWTVALSASLLPTVCAGSIAQAAPSIRGFVVGSAFDLFAPSYPGSGVGNLTPWRFGYRPDVPQDSTGSSAPPAFGLDSILQGYYPNGDDWPVPYLHICYGNNQTTPLPITDLKGRTTLYDYNLGSFASHGFPGVYELNITTPGFTFPDGTTIAASDTRWGGFYGVIKGTGGSISLQGAPWSSPGSDFGSEVPFSPQPSAVNLVIYDLGGHDGIPASAPALVSGHKLYDLTSPSDPTTVGSNRARGKVSLRRKDFGARYLYGNFGDGSTNTLVIQGLWEIAGAEGTLAYDPAHGLNGPIGPSDIGKGVGTWGQPQRFFSGVLYNDFTFRNLLPGSSAFAEKYLTYEFLPAALDISRTYSLCTQQLCLNVRNMGDVDLYDVTITDPDVPGGTLSIPGRFAQNTSLGTLCFPLAGLPNLSGVSTVGSSKFRIERAPDRLGPNSDGTTGTIADGTLPSGDTVFRVTASSNGSTQLDRCAQITGTIFCDQDSSGKPDAGEGVGNVPVHLIGADLYGSPVSADTNTASDGTYAFLGLPPGTYVVTYDLPAGYYEVEAYAGVGGTKNDTHTITVMANTPGTSDYSPQNFSISAFATISGTVYTDLNKNSALDGGEPGLGSVTVTLNGPGGTQTTPTAADGTYSFTNLVAGTYTVSVPSAANGENLETASALSVALAPCQNGTADFGYVVPATGKGCIEGKIFCDDNNNGRLDCGEDVLGGVIVTLKDSNGNVVATTTTNSKGCYQFKNLLDGTYTVNVPDVANGLKAYFTCRTVVIRGGCCIDKNFRYHGGAICGVAFCDKDGDGKLDKYEQRLGGVWIVLTDSKGKFVDCTVTDCYGRYCFNDCLAAGKYYVYAPCTVGKRKIETTNPLCVMISAGQESDDNNFGYDCCNGSIKGCCFVDKNSNCCRDRYEKWLCGVEIKLYDCDGNFVCKTTTDSKGCYHFDSLSCGKYHVKAPDVCQKHIRHSHPDDCDVKSACASTKDHHYKPCGNHNDDDCDD